MAAKSPHAGDSTQRHAPPTSTALAAFLAGCVLLVASGCGNQGPRSCHIQGVVTIDGTPAREGTLRFDILTEGDLPSGAAISNGRYETWIAPGPKLVQIVVAGSREGLSERDMARNIVPPKYEKDPPRIDVKKSGVFDFHLTND